MELFLSKEAVKFLEKLSAKEAEKIREKLVVLLEASESEGIIPFNELDIKSLKGDWKGFLRMRVGKARIIFRIDAEADRLQVYDIDFRGNIYKSLRLGSAHLSVTTESLNKAGDRLRPNRAALRSSNHTRINQAFS